MLESPLYEDEQIKITLDPYSAEEQLLWIKEVGEEYKTNYLIPRSCLRDFALCPRGKLESRLQNISPEMTFDIKNKIGIDGAHIAICQAYHENEERIRRGVEEMIKEQENL